MQKAPVRGRHTQKLRIQEIRRAGEYWYCLLVYTSRRRQPSRPERMKKGDNLSIDRTIQRRIIDTIAYRFVWYKVKKVSICRYYLYSKRLIIELGLLTSLYINICKTKIQ
jgi:hypothetical protein